MKEIKWEYGTLTVGDVVKIKRPVMRLEPGDMGIVYEIYDDFEAPGLQAISVIFEDFSYDGFSVVEQELCFDQSFLYHMTSLSDYKFKNVLQLQKDFTNGVFYNQIQFLNKHFKR